MAERVNPWKLKRPARPMESKDFTDPDQPGVTLTLTFQRATVAQLTDAAQNGENYTEEWAGKDIPAPDGGEPAQVGPALCQTIALLEALDAQPEAERYSFLDWIGISLTMPAAFMEVGNWSQKFIPGADRLGNSPKGRTSPSPPPSSETTDSTQK